MQSYWVNSYRWYPRDHSQCCCYIICIIGSQLLVSHFLKKKSKEFLIHNTNNQKDPNAGIRWKIGSHKWLSHCLNQFFLPQTPKGKMSQQSFKWKDVTSTTGVIKTPNFHPKLEIGPSNQCAQKSVNNCFLGIKVNYHWSP